MEKQKIISELAIKINQEIIKQPERQLQKDEPLISSGLIDSFSLVDLALIVESAFNVRIEDFELNSDTFDTLDQLANLILARL